MSFKYLCKFQSRTASLTSARSESSIVESLLQEENEEEANIKVKDLQEESSKGKVGGSLFFKYMLAGGNCFFVGTVLILYVLAQAAASAVDYFVSYWVKVEEYRSIPPQNHTTAMENNGTSVTAETVKPTTDTFLYIYGGLIVTLFVVALSRSMSFYKLAMLSSQNLHDSMFSSVVNTNMRFFDTNPSGRILNRFSKDIGSIDELLPKAVLDAGQVSCCFYFNRKERILTNQCLHLACTYTIQKSVPCYI